MSNSKALKRARERVENWPENHAILSTQKQSGSAASTSLPEIKSTTISPHSTPGLPITDTSDSLR